MTQGWHYYNHAMIPTTAPHEDPDITPIKNNTIWSVKERPILARWTSDWDCGHITNWWYVIKDEPFDITKLKSKRRYEITKGNKHFIVREINPTEWCDQLFKVTIAAYDTYDASYRPNLTYEKFVEDVNRWDFYKTYAAFSVENNLLCGYGCLLKKGKYIDFCMMKADPEREKYGLNAAILYKILMDHTDFLENGGYICDGSRSIQHKTAFQDYLEKYFGFRKAYCELHIVYAPKYRFIIKIAYRFRKLLSKMDKVSVAKKLSALLRMEELLREPVQENYK